jgi:hypothetical protein
MKRILQALCFILFSVVGISAAEPVVQVGEELVYEVSYSGVKLGSITMKTEGMQAYNGEQVYKMKCTMKSYPSIPFVGLHVTYESWIDKSLTNSEKFVGNYEDNGWVYQEILFNYDKHTLSNQKFKNKQKIFSKQMEISGKMNDGLSLFFLARKYSKNKKSYRLPVFVDDTAAAVINFTGKKEDVQIEAVKYPVKTIYLNGNLEFKGVYGLSGKYQGWFSDDNARIPIKAEMNVMVGKVKIELKSWKRTGWNPPEAEQS